MLETSDSQSYVLVTVRLCDCSKRNSPKRLSFEIEMDVMDVAWSVVLSFEPQWSTTGKSWHSFVFTQ